MRHILKVVLFLSAAASLPAFADPDKNESGHYWEGRPSWTHSFESEREARKHYEELAREAQKHRQESRHERRKHYEELERESHKHALEMERESGGRYHYRGWYTL